jgi:ABC-type sugar transport system permease subunit
VAGIPDQEGIMPSLSHTHEGNDHKHHRDGVFVLALVCMWLISVVASAVVWRLLFALS